MPRVFLEVNPPGCRCKPSCSFPCFQRVGWAPACAGCGCDPFPEEDGDVREAA